MFPVQLCRIRGIILHRTSVREQDRMIDVYSREEGRLWCFAPGVRHVSSRRSGHLEPFMETHLTVAKSGRGYVVKEARTIQSFPRIRENLERIQDAYAIVQRLRDHIGEGQCDEKLYTAVHKALSFLDRHVGKQSDFVLIRTAVDVHILNTLGCLPDLYRCCVCRERLEVEKFAEARDLKGGFVCTGCGGESDPSLTDPVRVCRALHSNVITRISDLDSNVLLRTQEVIEKRFGAFVRTKSR